MQNARLVYHRRQTIVNDIRSGARMRHDGEQSSDSISNDILVRRSRRTIMDDIGSGTRMCVDGKRSRNSKTDELPSK